MAGMLYLVPTPIGNLGDISQRCRETLEQADFIAAEDTRVSLKLLNHLNIKKPLVSYYEHNRTESGQRILERLLAGETCALVSDAGSPAISDPGEDLVALCAANGIVVSAIPGPCAVITALSMSGLPTGRFTFEGFLSTNKKNRQEHLRELAGEQRTMIFYEAPHKLLNTLQGALDYYQELAPRGEYVLVLEGAEPPQEEELTLEKALELVSAKMEQGLSRKDAVKQVAKETGFPKNALYDAALQL